MRRQGCAWCSHPVGRDGTILTATDANLHPTKKERSTFVGGALLDVFPDSPDDRNSLASVRNVAQLMRMRRSNDPELVWCHGHTLQVVVPDEPLLVRGDATRRTRVVTNLLTNAAKYAQRDGHISEVAHGGLGIGLSLVKQLVELHDGSLEAPSEGMAEGSVFTASLPLAVYEQTPASDTASDTASEPASEPAVAANEVAEQPQCILVVDDNVDVAESMSMLLRFRGHEVFVAHNGVNALQLAEQVSPAVVLLDIGLPDLDGYEVCRRLRRSGLEKARIIAMTGYGLERDRQLAEAAGFDEHCVKPVTYADLLKLLSA